MLNSSLQSPWSLPIFVTRENKYIFGFFLFMFAAALYLASNHLHWVEPQLLAMTWLDSNTPFVPNTVWIYLSEYIYFVALYGCVKDTLNINKYFYSFTALQVISGFIFWCWPTTYPRNQFPLSDDLSFWTNLVFNALRTADSPANCCPSLHVSSVYLTAFIFLDEQRGKFPFFFLWATAIAISTLTTKQHYLVDVISGFGMAASTYWFFHRAMSYRPAHSHLLGQADGAQAKR